MSSDKPATALIVEAAAQSTAEHPRPPGHGTAKPADGEQSRVASDADDLSTIVDRVSHRLVGLARRRRRLRNLKRAALLLLAVVVLAGAGVGGWYAAWYAGAPVVNPSEWFPAQLVQLQAR